jgi:long-chain acyl-CoA synthetase
MTVKDPEFKSLHEFLINSSNVIHNPDYTFLMHKKGKEYVSISYRETFKNINQWSAYLYHLGFRKGDKVAMVIENGPEFIFLDQALQKLGIVNVSIYPTLTPAEIAFIINDSKSKGLLIGSPFLLKQFQKVEKECLTIEKVFTNFDNKLGQNKYITVEQLKKEGEQLFPSLEAEIDNIFHSVGHDDLAALIYTSGTTGVPKGTMLSHYNFMSNCYDAKDLCPSINKEDRFLSFLPLSHVFERMVGYYLPTFIGAQIAFAESIEKIAQNFNEVHPSLMACVPRLLERLEGRIRGNAEAKGGLSAKIFFWSLKVGEKVRIKRENGKTPGLFLQIQHFISEKLVFSKIKNKLGGRLKLLVSGGGALPQHIGEFFGNIGIRCQQGYGLTETSPFVSVNEFERQIHGTSGRVAPRQQVAIQNIETKELITVQTYNSFQPDFESEEGEILCKGPNIMKGYYNNPEETALVMDADGWFHTGDIGKFEKGYIKITDRYKNMLKTSLGKNIYPTPIENNYLQSDKIEQIFIIGDKKEYVTAIIVPKENHLSDFFGLNKDFFESEDDVIMDEKIKTWIEEDIKKLSQSLSNYARIRDFVIKRKPFSIESGELTVTLKQKRKIIEERYNYWIEQMYQKKNA